MMGLIALVAMTMLTACSDDDLGENPQPLETEGQWQVSIVSADEEEDQMLYWRPSFESITVSIAGRTDRKSVV